VKERVAEILNRRPAAGRAVGVVRNGALESFYGHGAADMASRAPVTEDTAFRIASITKTFTAVAVMQLWEQGLVDLDAPADEYLRAYRLVPAKAAFRPPTLRHLLTHTSGIGELQRLGDPSRWAAGGRLEPPKCVQELESPCSSLRVVSRTPRRSLPASSRSAASNRARAWPSHSRRLGSRFPS
jgi:CubicO group peptidase (beta-lactamase class C family)